MIIERSPYDDALGRVLVTVAKRLNKLALVLAGTAMKRRYRRLMALQLGKGRKLRRRDQ